MNLHFLLNEQVLLYEALTRNVDKEGWTDVKKELWEKYQKGYEFLQGNYHKALTSNNFKKYVSDSYVDAEKLFSEVLTHPKFKELLQETNELRIRLNGERILSYKQ